MSISRYFRQSLIDSERLCPADKDILPIIGCDKKQDPAGNYLAQNYLVWTEGRIDASLAEQILDARQPPNKLQLQQLEIVIYPRVDMLMQSGGAKNGNLRTVLIPVAIFANLMRDGKLSPTNKAPWIPRVWIGPTQEGANQPFTEMTLLDQYFTHNPFEGIDSWPQLVSYTTRLLCHVGRAQYKGSNEQLFDIKLLENYEPSSQCLIQLTPPVTDAKKNMMKVLDYLINKNSFPRLYQNYSSRRDSDLRVFTSKTTSKLLAKHHVGQMTGEFPLASNQRNALHYFLEQGDGDILAVNGPPGTGKTTLLRSIVANLWTQAALNHAEPPIIVATSNNNQAVTNILESFARVDEVGLDEHLQGRWIPEIDSYGLYFCSQGKATKDNLYRYAGPKGEGCMSEWQTTEFVTKAQTFFLSKLASWQSGSNNCSSIDCAINTLHNAMSFEQSQIDRGLDLLESWQASLVDIEQRYGSVESLESLVRDLNKSLFEHSINVKRKRDLLDAVYGLWESRSWLISLLLWIATIRKQESRKTARLLKQWNSTITVFTDDEVEIELTNDIDNERKNHDKIQKQLVDLEGDLQRFEELSNQLNEWMKPADSIQLFAKTITEKVSEISDRYYRFRLFKLATHYFEARWLKETKAFVESNDQDKKSLTKVLRKLRRYAKLTPCFVSTFYMVPSTFIAGEFRDKVWAELPLIGAIDLLVVDEAGQALSDVSAVSFALAKKAVIVGDTDQIEPVWNIPASIDRSNLAMNGLLSDDADYDRWLESGLLASSGNVMRIAQRQCHYHQFEMLQRGLYLTEHRRCFNNIVGYCNDLIYKGLLEPMRGEAKHVVPWGTMSMKHVCSPSSSFGGSRGNYGEAKEIANWLAAERSVIVAYARQQDDKYLAMDDLSVLKKTVGIITPFSKQAQLIKNELQRVGVSGLTVGTVHSLQGDERLIVLFSSVYGENEKNKGKFYDVGSNMLNVAVSRAKDSFIVFGDLNVFGVNVIGSPSGLLRKRLTIIN